MHIYIIFRTFAVAVRVINNILYTMRCVVNRLLDASLLDASLMDASLLDGFAYGVLLSLETLGF